MTAELALGLVSGSAHAAPLGRDLNGSIGSFETYYDTDLNITWLADANVNGLIIWADANIWAANLSGVRSGACDSGALRPFYTRKGRPWL